MGTLLDGQRVLENLAGAHKDPEPIRLGTNEGSWFKPPPDRESNAGLDFGQSEVVISLWKYPRAELVMSCKHSAQRMQHPPNKAPGWKLTQPEEEQSNWRDSA